MTVAVTVLGWFIGVAIVAVLFWLLAWNVGAVGLASAVGGNVSTISYWTAFGAVLLLRFLGGAFTSNKVVTEK